MNAQKLKLLMEETFENKGCANPIRSSQWCVRQAPFHNHGKPVLKPNSGKFIRFDQEKYE